MGGAANGMPRNAVPVLVEIPKMGPAVVFAVGLAPKAT